MNINHNLTESHIKNIDVKSQLEHQIQFHETKESVWMFDKIIAMEKRFFKTGEKNSLSYVKSPLRSNAFLNKKNNDKYC